MCHVFELMPQHYFGLIFDSVNGSPLYKTLAVVWLAIQVTLNFILAGANNIHWYMRTTTNHSTTGNLVYIYHKIGEKISNILPRFAKVLGILVKCNIFGSLFCLLTLILAVSTP